MMTSTSLLVTCHNFPHFLRVEQNSPTGLIGVFMVNQFPRFFLIKSYYSCGCNATAPHHHPHVHSQVLPILLASIGGSTATVIAVLFFASLLLIFKRRQRGLAGGHQPVMEEEGVVEAEEGHTPHNMEEERMPIDMDQTE